MLGGGEQGKVFPTRVPSTLIGLACTRVSAKPRQMVGWMNSWGDRWTRSIPGMFWLLLKTNFMHFEGVVLHFHNGPGAVPCWVFLPKEARSLGEACGRLDHPESTLASTGLG